MADQKVDYQGKTHTIQRTYTDRKLAQLHADALNGGPDGGTRGAKNSDVAYGVYPAEKQEMNSDTRTKMQAMIDASKTKRLAKEDAEQMDEYAPLIAAAARVAGPLLARKAGQAAAGKVASKGMGDVAQKIAGRLASGAVTRAGKAIENRANKSQQQQNEMAPEGDKYERMVRHIKKGYAKGGLTKQEKSIAYATAWKAKNREDDDG
jgi:hypothetical protein